MAGYMITFIWQGTVVENVKHVTFEDIHGIVYLITIVIVVIDDDDDDVVVVVAIAVVEVYLVKLQSCLVN